MFSEFPLSHETDIPESRQLAALAASRHHFHLNGSPMRPGVSGAGMDTGKVHGPEIPFRYRFPQSTHFIDGVEIHTTGATGAVMWMSDWSRAWELRDAGRLRVEYGGPHNYGHDTLYVVL